MKRSALLLALATIFALAVTPGSTQPAPPATPTAPAPVKRAPAAKTTPAPVANQYTTESEAKQRCGTDVVVWANTSTKIYHFAGYKDYGKTIRGAYMCKAEADRSGIRAAKNEKQKA